MKNNKLIAFLLTIAALTSCSTTLLSPDENKGLEGNASLDSVEIGSIENLYKILLKASSQNKYSYEVTEIGFKFIIYYFPKGRKQGKDI